METEVPISIVQFSPPDEAALQLVWIQTWRFSDIVWVPPSDFRHPPVDTRTYHGRQPATHRIDSPYLSGMRPLLASILALSILLPSMVYFSGVSWRRDQLRKEAKQTILQDLPAASLFRMTIPIDGILPKSFVWIKDGEFQFQGMMYDVVMQTRTADSIVLVAWADHHEAAFESSLDHLMARMLGTDPVHGHIQLSFAQFLKQLYPPGTWQSSHKVYRLDRHPPVDLTGGLYHQYILHPPTPPPQLFG